MNAIITLTILALALIAACNAMGYKDSINFCNDDSQLSNAEIAFVKANKVDGASENVQDWTQCYYANLNIFARFNDFAENLGRKSYVAQFPTKILTGNQIILNCNAQAKVTPQVSKSSAWAFHVCMVNNGFKI